MHQDTDFPGTSHRNKEEYSPRKSYHRKSVPSPTQSSKQSKLPANRASYPAYGSQDRPESSQRRKDIEFSTPPLRYKEKNNPRTSYQPKSSPKPTQSAQAGKTLANRASYPVYGSQDQPEFSRSYREGDAPSTLHRNEDRYNRDPGTPYYPMSPSKPMQSIQVSKTPANRASYPAYGSQDQSETSRVRRDMNYDPEEYSRRASYHPTSLLSPTQAFQSSQLPPGSIPYNTPIIIYAPSGPPEEKKSLSSSFTRRLKKAFAALTENPDEAMLGCKPGKTNEEFKAKRAERLKEMADEELKYKNRPTIIKKWIERGPDEDEPPLRAREQKTPSQAVPRESNHSARQNRVEEGIRRSRGDAYSRK